MSLLLTSSESKYRYKTFGDKRQDWNSVHSLTIKIIITYKWTPLIRLATSGPAPSESYNRTYLIQVKWGNKRKNQFHINCLHYLDILIIRTLLNLIIINKDCIRHVLNSLPSFTTRITFLKMINFEILPKMSTISTDFPRNRKGSWAKFKSWDQSGEPLLPTLSLSWTRGRTVPGDDFESYKRLINHIRPCEYWKLQCPPYIVSEIQRAWLLRLDLKLPGRVSTVQTAMLVRDAR